ncbi:hypothetical protein AADS67_004972 [Escherichia coli]
MAQSTPYTFDFYRASLALIQQAVQNIQQRQRPRSNLPYPITAIVQPFFGAHLFVRNNTGE